MEIPQTGRVANPAGAGQVKDFSGKVHREEWQTEAYHHANEIGELGYVLTLIGSTVAKGQLVVEETDEHGNIIEPERDDEGRQIIEGDRAKAERVLDALRGPYGDHKSLLAAAAIHDQVAGEAILLGEPIEDTTGISWEVVSVLEVIQDANTKQLTRKRSASQVSSLSVVDGPSATTPLDENAYLSRYHRPDLAYSGDATSPLRRNAGVCREIVLLDQLKETMIKGRLAAGVLLVPEEVTFPADDDSVEDVGDADRFLEMLIEHLSAPVEDRRSASSLSPLVVRVPGDLIEKWKLLSLTDGLLDLSAVKEARDDALRRLAAGIDLPMERMQGMGSSNHWSAAGIEVDEARRHILPLGERLARFFTASYFRRMLIAFEDFDPQEAERWSLGYDGSEVLTRMDIASAADALWADGLISDDARIEAHGFDPDQVRPKDPERWRRLIERLAVVPNANNRVLLSALIDFEAAGIPAETVEAWLTVPPAPEPAAIPPGDTPADDTPDTPDTPAGPSTPATGEPGPQDEPELAVLERVRSAAAYALDRALERAASQVVTNRRLPKDTKARTDQPKYRTQAGKVDVLPLLADGDWKAIDRTPEQLVRNAFDPFSQQAVVWLSDHYQGCGVRSVDANERAHRVVSDLVRQLDALALSAFRRPLEPELGLSVPMDLVTDCLGASAR